MGRALRRKLGHIIQRPVYTGQLKSSGCKRTRHIRPFRPPRLFQRISNIQLWQRNNFISLCADQRRFDSMERRGIIQDIGNASYPSETLKAVNDVDSNVLQYHGQKTKSLFYEGTVSYENKIRPVYNADRKQALVENKGTYPVYDVLLIAPSNYNKLLGKYLYTDVIPKIAPNEVVTVTLRQTPSGVDYAKDLTRLGYTGKEAEAFAGIWEQEFQKTEKGNGKLIYRLSQEEYNNMIPLKISPEPVKTIRTMYVMICLTGKDTPQAPSSERALESIRDRT